MDAIEAKVNQNENDLESKLRSRLLEARDESGSNEVKNDNTPDIKPRNKLTSAATKSFCWLCNFVSHKGATYDVPPDVADAVKPVFKTTAEEIEVTQNLLDEHAPDLLDDETIALLNKYSSFGPFIQVYGAKMNVARAEIRMILKERSKGEK